MSPESATMIPVSSSEDSAWLEVDRLLAADDSHVYDRFSQTNRKNFIVTAVSFAGLLSGVQQSNTNYLTVLIFILSIQRS